MNETVKETLQKQLQLLSERSKEPGADLPGLTHAMCEIAATLPSENQNYSISGGLSATFPPEDMYSRIGKILKAEITTAQNS